MFADWREDLHCECCKCSCDKCDSSPMSTESWQKYQDEQRRISKAKIEAEMYRIAKGRERFILLENRLRKEMEDNAKQ